MAEKRQGRATQSPKGPKVRTPRTVTVHPCRICTQPVTADSPETALHPSCRIDTPKCSECGHEPAIPDPNCTVCAGTGTIASSACPWCAPAPGPACIMAEIIEGARRRREQREHIGDCPGCGFLSALPLGPLCAPCTVTDEHDRALFEMVG